MEFEFFILDTIAKLHTDFFDTILPVITAFGNAGMAGLRLPCFCSAYPNIAKQGLP